MTTNPYQLPNECWIMILSELPLCPRIRLSMTCKLFRILLTKIRIYRLHLNTIATDITPINHTMDKFIIDLAKPEWKLIKRLPILYNLKGVEVFYCSRVELFRFGRKNRTYNVSRSDAIELHKGYQFPAINFEFPWKKLLGYLYTEFPVHFTINDMEIFPSKELWYISLTHNYIFMIDQDDDYTFRVCVYDTTHLFLFGIGTFFVLPAGVVEDSQSNIYVACNDLIIKYNKKGSQSKTYRTTSLIHTIVIDPIDRIFIVLYNDSNIYLYNTNGQLISTLQHPNISLPFIALDYDNNLVILSGPNLYSCWI